MTPYYEQDGIVIYHGDCREWFHTTAPKSVGLVATDPPYGVGIQYASYKDDPQATTALVCRFVEMAKPVARCLALTAGMFDTELALYRTHPPRWRMCWYKGAQTTASPIGFNDWEAVLIYGDDIHNHAHDWFYAQPEGMGAFGHPCPKPLLFARTLIARLAKPHEIICDPFMGSGTTLRAAKDMGHPAIGIEIEERYCEIAAKRLAQGALPLEMSAEVTP